MFGTWRAVIKSPSSTASGTNFSRYRNGWENWASWSIKHTFSGNDNLLKIANHVTLCGSLGSDESGLAVYQSIPAGWTVVLLDSWRTCAETLPRFRRRRWFVQWRILFKQYISRFGSWSRGNVWKYGLQIKVWWNAFNSTIEAYVNIWHWQVCDFLALMQVFCRLLCIVCLGELFDCNCSAKGFNIAWEQNYSKIACITCGGKNWLLCFGFLQNHLAVTNQRGSRSSYDPKISPQWSDLRDHWTQHPQ